MANVITFPAAGGEANGPSPAGAAQGGTPMRFSGIVAAIFLLQFAVVGAEAQRWMAQTPFAGLAGTWSGSGTVSLTGGGRERIRCRSTYRVGSDGTAVQGNLRCASDSYQFELASQIDYGAGAVNGTWSETTSGVSGTLTGQADVGQLSARATAPGFTADLSLSTRGRRQVVTIRSQGTDLTGASLTLNRE
ncbi:hypothetical protein [Methylorubrum extorquens]|uniref:hypothetical protein n=1 Tax=Methylorubrum extorquens TaxID=408 RepID=UPI000158F9C4|nr:hypothetical protein [Methylorubrum extorquens]ABY28944.1 conserved hypothetical protein [Methylorubrum extorquens PA1]KQP94530.1 hypothetical protein ASF55_17755 [Methylobacterium sp. Leaf119]WIU40300.1 hypothetical protein KQ926_02780 [Methylorubrum extorquens]